MLRVLASDAAAPCGNMGPRRHREPFIAAPRRFIALAAAFLGAALGAQAPAQTAGLLGKVTDKGGAPIAGANVEARNVATGVVRRAVAERDGGYRLPSIVPGDYRVRIALSGFADTERSVTLNIGQETRLDFALELATYEATVTIVDEAPLVHTEESDLSTVIDEDQIDNLPLNGRTFQSLAVLAPGATTAYTFDPTKTRVGAISIGTQIGRGINVTIDGGDNNDDAVGGILQQYSAESIQEFEVITQRFKPEYGRSGGGVISVITKSGTNAFHGDVFGYYRGKSLNGKEYFQENEGLAKPNYKRLQEGFTIGGPIIRDRTHFFVAYERQDEDAYHTVNTSGFWPEYEGTVKQPFWQNLVTAKLDHTLTDNQFLTLRYDFENNDRYEDGLEILGATSAASAGGIQHNELWSALLNHTWIASQMALNEAVFQASYFDNTIENIHDDPRLHFPHLVRGSYGSAQETIQKKYQWKDDFSYHSGHHDWKAGVDWIHSPELFVNNPFLSAGSFYYSVDDADAAPFAFFSTYGDARARRPNDQVGIYIQDDWTIGERLVLNLGLRYDVEFGTFDVPETLIGRAIEDNPAARREAGFERGTLKNDVDNIGPRLGFAWDARGDGKTVVRGGTGIFYDQIFFSITLFDDLLTNDPPFVGVLIFSPTFGPGNIPDLSEYATPANAFPYFTSPDLQTPYSVQRSLGISQQIGEHLAVDADAVLVRGVHEFRQRRINIDPDGDGPLPRPISEEFGTVNLSETTGESWYRALHLALRGRWGKASLQISATIADAETHQGDFGYAPQNNLHDNAPDHTRRDIGKPVNFEPWRLVASGIYELPAGFQVSGIVQAAHARPYTTSYGYDLNGDGVSNDRPDGLGDRYGDPFFMADLRVSKFFRFGHGPNVEASVDVFNVFDTVNFGSSYDGSLYSGSPDNPNPTYGKPTATFGPPRQIQLGLRINF